MEATPICTECRGWGQGHSTPVFSLTKDTHLHLGKGKPVSNRADISVQIALLPDNVTDAQTAENEQESTSAADQEGGRQDRSLQAVQTGRMPPHVPPPALHPVHAAHIPRVPLSWEQGPRQTGNTDLRVRLQQSERTQGQQSYKQMAGYTWKGPLPSHSP